MMPTLSPRGSAFGRQHAAQASPRGLVSERLAPSASEGAVA
jgi:hypothetical protein